jgi:hypothetical protein
MDAMSLPFENQESCETEILSTESSHILRHIRTIINDCSGRRKKMSEQSRRKLICHLGNELYGL